MNFDKSEWPEGPWIKENDSFHGWTQQGYPYLILRNNHGALCGYVGVHEGHAAYGAGYLDSVVLEIQVHGGLTFTEQGGTGLMVHPDDSRPTWWLGFDCAHSFDLVPGLSGMNYEATYKNVRYVETEILVLSKQLANLRPESALSQPSVSASQRMKQKTSRLITFEEES